MGTRWHTAGKVCYWLATVSATVMVTVSAAVSAKAGHWWVVSILIMFVTFTIYIDYGLSMLCTAYYYFVHYVTN